MDEQSKQETAGKRMAVFLVTERDEKTSWLKLGSAHHNRDGSINLYLEAMPVAGVGKLQLRAEKPATSAHAAEGVRS